MKKLTTNALLTLLILTPDTAWSSHYADGVMQSPVAYHQLGSYGDGRFIAVSDCGKIGEWVMIRPLNGEWEFHQIADCAGADGTPEWMAANNIIAEVSHETAVRWGVVGGGFQIECIGCGR